MSQGSIRPPLAQIRVKMYYTVSQIKVNWPISCDISKVYARIIAKFNTGDHELFASNFYFYNMFLRPFILAVLMHI